MAGLPLQVGDIIALAKVAQTVIEYGWGQYSNAAKLHDEFYKDVEALHSSLLALDSIITNVGRGLEQQPASIPLRYHRRSLSEIIGDCKTTLDDCRDLLKKNKRFAGSSGAVRNIEYNVFVRGDVETLRKRVRQHVEKVAIAQGVLQLDLLTRISEDIHRVRWDIADGFQKLQDLFLKLPGMTADLLNSNTRHNFSFEDSFPGIAIPTYAAELFDSAYQSLDAPLGRPSLSDLTDVFVSSFYESTHRFRPGLDLILQRQPPNDQYVNLLKCKWLMGKIRASEELANAVPDSHWPSYINELDKRLTRECNRFSGQSLDGLEIPMPLTITETNARIWPEKTRRDNAVEQQVNEQAVEEIFRTQVTPRSEKDIVGLSLWRPVQQEDNKEELGASDEFRICFFFANGESREAGYPKTLDFSLKMARLQPIYAIDQDPTFGGSFIIETGLSTLSRTITKLDFPNSKAMMKFQHALTGYKVWDNKIFHASVKFVYRSGRKGDDMPSQDACLQLWIPRRLETLSNGPSSPCDSGISMALDRRFSTLSLASSRAPSIAETMRTTYTVGSTRTMPIQVEGNTSGILHVKPEKPLLVLFTRHPATGDPLMVTMELDALNVNPKRCDCHRSEIKSQQCLHVAIERDAGREGEPLPGVTRFEAVGEHQKEWDVSRLAFGQRGKPDQGRRKWTDLTRLTIKFHDVDKRREFSGERCACNSRGKNETWTDLQNCVKQNHRGLLGEVKMHYRRQVWECNEWPKQRQHVIYRE